MAVLEAIEVEAVVATIEAAITTITEEGAVVRHRHMITAGVHRATGTTTID